MLDWPRPVYWIGRRDQHDLELAGRLMGILNLPWLILTSPRGN